MELFATALFWIFIGGITSHYAGKRGRSPVTWFWIGLLFSIWGLLALFLMPSLAKSPAVITEPISPLPDHDSMEWYYADKSHVPQGPVSYSELMTLWNRYELAADSYVWTEGMNDWQRFGDVFKK